MRSQLRPDRIRAKWLSLVGYPPKPACQTRSFLERAWSTPLGMFVRTDTRLSLGRIGAPLQARQPSRYRRPQRIELHPSPDRELQRVPSVSGRLAYLLWCGIGAAPGVPPQTLPLARMLPSRLPAAVRAAGTRLEPPRLVLARSKPCRPRRSELAATETKAGMR